MTPDLDTWLITAISGHGGTANMRDIQAAATAADIPWRRIQRAKERLGIITVRSGFGNVTTTWTLPPDLVATLAATNGDDGNSGTDGTDATVTNRDDYGSLAPLAAALELLGGIVDTVRPMLAKFAAGRLPRQQVNDLKWAVAAACRALDTMTRNGITLDSLRRMIADETETAVSVWFHREIDPFLYRLKSGLGFDPDAEDVCEVVAWAITGEGPQPKVPDQRPVPVRRYPYPHNEGCGSSTDAGSGRVTWLCEHEFKWVDGRGWQRRSDGDNS